MAASYQDRFNSIKAAIAERRFEDAEQEIELDDLANRGKTSGFLAGFRADIAIARASSTPADFNRLLELLGEGWQLQEPKRRSYEFRHTTGLQFTIALPLVWPASIPAIAKEVLSKLEIHKTTLPYEKQSRKCTLWIFTECTLEEGWTCRAMLF